AIIFSIKGEPTRVVIVDQSNKIGPRLKENLSTERIEAKARAAAKEQMVDLNASQEEKMKRGASQMASGFVLIDFDANGKTVEHIRQELNAMAAGDEIDAYLLIPADIDAKDAKFDFRSRKAGDFVASDTLKDALNEAVRSQRLSDAHINEDSLKNLSQNVDFESKSISETGEQKDRHGLFI